MGLFPWDPSKPVITAWDIGWSDDTSIWFVQIHGKEIHVIDFWTGSGYSLDEVLEELQEFPYVYEPFWLPHDAKNKSFQTGKSIRELMWEAGAKTQQVPELSVQDGITAVRATLPKVYFNTGNENVRKYGLPALVMYQREYDEVKRVYRQKPRHDWASNPADAFRYLCLAVNPFTAKTADRTLQMAKPQTPANNVLNLENLFADRAARRVNERI